MCTEDTIVTYHKEIVIQSLIFSQVGSNKMYNGNGYMGCNGYVPCQVRFVFCILCFVFADLQICTFCLIIRGLGEASWM